MVFAALILFAVALVVLLGVLPRRIVRAASPPPGPFVRPRTPIPPPPTLRNWDADTGLPVFRCGSIWRDGREVGATSCNRLAEHFWITMGSDEVWCWCRMCHSRDRRVPNGRDASREEAQAVVAMQDVMLS